MLVFRSSALLRSQYVTYFVVPEGSRLYHSKRDAEGNEVFSATAGLEGVCVFEFGQGDSQVWVVLRSVDIWSVSGPDYHIRRGTGNFLLFPSHRYCAPDGNAFFRFEIDGFGRRTFDTKPLTEDLFPILGAPLTGTYGPDGNGFLIDLFVAPSEEDAHRFFVRGDLDGDGTRNLTDGLRLLNGLFHGGELPCLDAADADDDGKVNITDALLLLHHLFGLFGGISTLPLPHSVCAPDPTEDGLDCGGQPICSFDVSNPVSCYSR